MKNLNDYFDLAKERSGSDYKTAKALGVSPNRISMARKDGVMSNEFAVDLAMYIETPAIEIIAAAEVAKKPEKEAKWVKCLGSAAAVFAFALLGSSLLFSGNTTAYNFEYVLQCILCSIGITVALAQISSYNQGNWDLAVRD